MKSETDSLNKDITNNTISKFSKFSEIPKLTKADLDNHNKNIENIENKILFETEVFNNVNSLKKDKQIIFSYEWRIEF